MIEQEVKREHWGGSKQPARKECGRWGQAVSADHAVTLSWQISTGHSAVLKLCSPFLPLYSVSAESNCTDPRPQTRKTSVLYHILSFLVLFFNCNGVVSLSPRISILLNLLTLETWEYTEFRFPRDEGCLKKKKKRRAHWGNGRHPNSSWPQASFWFFKDYALSDYGFLKSLPHLSHKLMFNTPTLWVYQTTLYCTF